MSMKVAIRGIEKENKLLLNLLKQSKDIEVSYYIDINGRYWGGYIDEIPVISPMKAANLYKEGEIEKIFLSSILGITLVEHLVKEMILFGILEKDICIPAVEILYNQRKISKNDLESLNIQKLKQLYYLEYHIADHCNLNCAGCSHFSSLCKEESFSEYMTVEKDFQQLKKFVNHIEWIRILGGEPFLNRDWKEYIVLTKKYYPYAKISIVTNGIKISMLQEEDIEFIKQQDIEINISLYKPLWNQIDNLVSELKKKEVRYQVMGDPIFTFNSTFDLESKDNFIWKRTRCDSPCNNIYKGKMTPCPQMMYVEIFNKYFKKDLPEEKPVDLYSINSFEELKKALEKPMDLCQYCNKDGKHKWKQVKENIEISSWLI